MKPVWWMIGSCLISWLAVAALPAVESDRDVLLGMAAPLAAAVGTWVMVQRTYGSHPERLTPLMIAAFGGKMVFFGAYVTLMITLADVRPIPFVISFTVYFIALYLMEALWMQRLFSGRMPAPK